MLAARSEQYLANRCAWRTIFNCVREEPIGFVQQSIGDSQREQISCDAERDGADTANHVVVPIVHGVRAVLTGGDFGIASQYPKLRTNCEAVVANAAAGQCPFWINVELKYLGEFIRTQDSREVRRAIEQHVEGHLLVYGIDDGRVFANCRDWERRRSGSKAE